MNKAKPYEIVGYNEIKNLKSNLGKDHKLSYKRDAILKTSKSFAVNPMK